MAYALDTHLIYKELVEAGFNAQQAEAIKSGMMRVQQSGIENLATKQDIYALKEDLAKLEINFLKWGTALALSVVGLTSGLTFALVKLLP